MKSFIFFHLRIGCITTMPCGYLFIYFTHFSHKNIDFQKTPAPSQYSNGGSLTQVLLDLLGRDHFPANFWGLVIVQVMWRRIYCYIYSLWVIINKGVEDTMVGERWWVSASVRDRTRCVHIHLCLTFIWPCVDHPNSGGGLAFELFLSVFHIGNGVWPIHSETAPFTLEWCLAHSLWDCPLHSGNGAWPIHSETAPFTLGMVLDPFTLRLPPSLWEWCLAHSLWDCSLHSGMVLDPFTLRLLPSLWNGTWPIHS